MLRFEILTLSTTINEGFLKISIYNILWKKNINEVSVVYSGWGGWGKVPHAIKIMKTAPQRILGWEPNSWYSKEGSESCSGTLGRQQKDSTFVVSDKMSSFLGPRNQRNIELKFLYRWVYVPYTWALAYSCDQHKKNLI